MVLRMLRIVRPLRNLSVCFLSRRRFFAILLTVAILTGAGWWWKNPAPLLWSDIRKGDGAVLSLATGKDPSGNEIIVAGGYFRTDASGLDLRVLCYDAAKGQVRWQARENKALPNMMTDPIIAIDSAGDVLVGWETAAARLGCNKAVSKYAGADGRLLWDWNFQNIDSGTSMIAIPVPNHADALWVSGIRKPGHRRFIAALDPKTGNSHWEADLNAARDGLDRPAQIHHLKEGGSMVIIPPEFSHSWTFPWIIQHRLKDGGLRWKQEVIRENDRSLQELEWLVDEKTGQIVLVWNSVTGGRMHFDMVAFDLTLGVERWHVRDIIAADDFRSGVEAVTQGKDGGIELWGRRVKEIIHTKWWRWRMDHGIPYPEQDGEIIEQPLRVTLSPSDGSVMKSELLARPKERIMARLARPGSSPEVLILCLIDHRESSHSDLPRTLPWRADLIAHESWLEFPKREPAGATTSLDFPQHSALTPSGRLVTGGDPAEDRRQWQIRVW